MPLSLREYSYSCKFEEKRISLKILSRILKQIDIPKTSEIFKITQKSIRYSDSLASIFYKEVNNTPILRDIKLPRYVPEMKPYELNISVYDEFLKGGVKSE